jgi:hypothetical protein
MNYITEQCAMAKTAKDLQHRIDEPGDITDEIARLRAEVAWLRAMPAARGTRPSSMPEPPQTIVGYMAMTKPRPSVLSDEQLALIAQGAKGFPPEWHDRFVDAVADELLPLADFTDADVNHAVTVVLLRIAFASRWHEGRSRADPRTAGRQSRIMLTLVFLVALVVAGFVVGLVWSPELIPWSR